jgi:hypothetical protein
MRQAMQVQYVPVRQINRRVSRSLERICHKALATDPERRYGTADALERALRRYLIHRRITMAGLAALCSMAVTLIALQVLTPHVGPPSDLPLAPTSSKDEAEALRLRIEASQPARPDLQPIKKRDRQQIPRLEEDD